MQQMKQDISRLLEVQEKERRLLSREKEKASLPLMLDELRNKIANAENSLSEAKTELKEIQVGKKELDLESESKLEEIAKYQKQQFEVKTNVEYQALQKEIAERKVENSRIEDKILEIMEQAEEKERLIKEREGTVGQEKARLAEEEKKVALEVAALDERITALKAERDVLLPGISPQALRKYQRIFQNKRDTALVPLVDYTCGGCHMRLPPQIANNVRKFDELVICENCSRILYWADGLDQKPEGAAPVSSGAPEPKAGT